MKHFGESQIIQRLSRYFVIFILTISNFKKIPLVCYSISLGGTSVGNNGYGPFEEIDHTPSYYTAILKVTSKMNGNTNSEIEERASFLSHTRIENEDGHLVKINLSQYCKKVSSTIKPPSPLNTISPLQPNHPSFEKWIALVDGKQCPDLLHHFINSLDPYSKSSSSLFPYPPSSSSSSFSSSLSSSSLSSSSLVIPPSSSFIHSSNSTIPSSTPSSSSSSSPSSFYSSSSFLPHISTLRNASALLIYNLNTRNDPQSYKDFIIVNIPLSRGHHLSRLLLNNTNVHISITIGNALHVRNYGNAINKTSMLFLSVSFVVLMVISLAWLVFYYVQRSRYTYAKQRLSRRLMRAAKKAVSKMPLKTIHSREDVGTECDICAVCIEGYRTSDVVRELPCRHTFHKPCIDPWLVEQRSCPICKIDILKAFGLQITQPGLLTNNNNASDQAHTSITHHHRPLPNSHESSLIVDVTTTNDSANDSTTREFDNDGVEIVRFHELAQVEHHRRSQISWSSTGSGGGGSGVSSAVAATGGSCAAVAGSLAAGSFAAGSLGGVSRLVGGDGDGGLSLGGEEKRSGGGGCSMSYGGGCEDGGGGYDESNSGGVDVVGGGGGVEGACAINNNNKILTKINDEDCKKINFKNDGDDEDDDEDEGDDDDARNGLLPKFTQETGI